MLDQKSLKSALTILKPYTTKAKPQLTLTFSLDKLTLSTTDLDLQIELFLACRNSIETSTSVAFNDVFDFIKSVTGEVSFTLQVNQLRITSGIASKTIPTMPQEDVLKPFEKASTYSLNTSTFNSNVFLKTLDHTAPCISDEETRYYLRGVYLHNDAQEIAKMVATNGHILACEQLAGFNYNGPPVIIPHGTVNFIKKLSKSFAETFQFQITDFVNAQNLIIIETDSFKITSKVIDGTFPDYARIIPKRESLDASFTIDANLLPKTGKHDDHCQFTSKGFTINEIDYSVPTGLPEGYAIAFGANYLRKFITDNNSVLTIHYNSSQYGYPCVISNKTDCLNVIMCKTLKK
jgi:DNA polymerase III sliding clamp (beta) subunit (PCNA family)